MTRLVSFHGNPLTLIGRVLKLGHIAPDFKAVTQDLKEVSLSEFKGQIKVISSFPSLDTPVCDLQVKEFNRRATGFSSDVVVLGISKDLPFAQKRFCQENDIKNEVVLSDYKFSSFGLNYGLLIKELNLLARAVVILDKSDVLRYLQIVDDLTHSIDYENVLVSLKEVSANPALSSKENLPTHCRPCEGGMPPMPKEKIERLLASHRGWQLIGDKEITKEFKFKDFVEAKYFFDLIALLAEEQGHHPTMTISYNRLKVTLTTHAVGGLSDNDFIMARIIDELGT